MPKCTKDGGLEFFFPFHVAVRVLTTVWKKRRRSWLVHWCNPNLMAFHALALTDWECRDWPFLSSSVDVRLSVRAELRKIQQEGCQTPVGAFREVFSFFFFFCSSRPIRRLETRCWWKSIGNRTEPLCGGHLRIGRTCVVHPLGLYRQELHSILCLIPSWDFFFYSFFKYLSLCWTFSPSFPTFNSK